MNWYRFLNPKILRSFMNEIQSAFQALSTLNTWLRCPWARHWTPSFSPGAAALNDCPLLWCVFNFTVCVCSRCVWCSLLCVCTWMGKCRARIQSMGHHIGRMSSHFQKDVNKMACKLFYVPQESHSMPTANYQYYIFIIFFFDLFFSI